MNAPAERKAPEKPDFTPDLLTILDYANRWVRERFFGRITGEGGLYKRIVFCLLLAYWYPY